MQVPFFTPNFDNAEIEAVCDPIKRKWLSMGPKTEALETRFSEQHGNRHPVGVTNGTAALHLAMHLLGIGPGDEVIVPSLSFAATASCALMAGATPIFADIHSEEDWTLSPEKAADAITPRTKAIIAMHYGGYLADLPTLRALCDKHHLALVEDACHAPLATRGNTHSGTVGDIACYSFYTNKNMTCGEGGMMLFKDPDLAQRAKRLRAHGMTATAHDREKKGGFYDIPEWGFNYRLDDLRASLGLAQLDKLPAEIERRNQLVQNYREQLSQQTSLSIPFSNYEGQSAHHLLPILLPDTIDRDTLRDELKDAGIGTSIHYPAIHTFGAFSNYATAPLPLTEKISDHELTLPLHGQLTKEQVILVCDTLNTLSSNRA